MTQILPERIADFKRVAETHGKKELGKVTASQTLGGMRDIPGLFWETSLLDAKEGIRFRGYSIPELQAKLPKRQGGGKDAQPLPEGVLWLLLTNEIPTESQVRGLTKELHARSKLPDHVEPLIRSLPKNMHPMTQLSTAVLACQTDSKFAAAYAQGMNKKKYWEPTFEDALNLIARLPRIAALIFQCSFKNGQVPADDPSLDYSANFARLLGFKKNGFAKDAGAQEDGFDEMLRLYLTIHSDHEGGNVSAHATHLVGSALSDAYFSFSAGLNGLAGPLHGLANQEVLKWTLEIQEAIKKSGKQVDADSVREQAWATLKGGKVIPGFGHAVLRQTDPRYMIQREFALKNLPNDELFKLVSLMFKVVPEVLKEDGRTKNPFPNVDAHSGCLLTYYGLKEYDYYTVLFGVSRAFGVLSQLVWSRAYNLPLERPKSVTLKFIEEFHQ